MIGIVDAETFTTKARFVPNLEVMKYYAWAKKEYEFPKLLGNSDLMEACDKLVVFQNDWNSQLPDGMWEHKNVEVNGLVFTGGKYKPFDNKEIEDMTPDLSVYDDFFRRRTNKRRATYYNMLKKRAGFMRIHTTGRLQEEQLVNKKWFTTFIYDEDVLANDGANILIELTKRNRPDYIPRYRFYYPLKIDSPKQLILLGENKILGTNTAAECYCRTEALIDFDASKNYMQEYLDLGGAKHPFTSLFSYKVPIIPKSVKTYTKDQALTYLHDSVKFYYDCLSNHIKANLVCENDEDLPYNNLLNTVATYTVAGRVGRYKGASSGSLYNAVYYRDNDDLNLLLSLFPENSKYRSYLTMSKRQIWKGDK